MSFLALLPASGCTHEAAPQGKVLHLVLKDNIRTTDPTNVYDVVGGELAAQIYESPYQYDYFSEDPSRIVPSLAEGMPEVSRDRLTFTIHVKKGVRFQDDPCFPGGKGRELTARDFIYAWKRHANPANESQGFWIWDGKVVGINDFQKMFGTRPADQVMSDEVEGLKALDDHTIQVKLLKPYPQLPYIMTMTFMAPVPPEAVKRYGRELNHHPVGTGPFRVRSYNPTARVVLVRNENYRDDRFPPATELSPRFRSYSAFSGRKLPLVDAIDFEVVKEEQPRWLGFLSGKYDSIEIPKDSFNSAVRDGKIAPDLSAQGAYLSVEPAFSYWYLSINMADKVLGSNKLLRQAIASTVDSKQWLEVFKNGRGGPQTEVNPPIIRDRCGRPFRWPYDLDRARQLLAKAGYPGGKGLPVFRYDTRNVDMAERQLADFFRMNLAKVGIQIDIIVNTFPAFLDKSYKGNLQLSKGGWVLDYPDPENTYALLYGPNRPPGSNEANFDNPDFNRLYEKLALMAPGQERRQVMCQLEDIVQEEVPWAYGIYEDLYRLGSRRLKNFHTAELVYTKWKYVYLD